MNNFAFFCLLRAYLFNFLAQTQASREETLGKDIRLFNTINYCQGMSPIKKEKVTYIKICRNKFDHHSSITTKIYIKKGKKLKALTRPRMLAKA